MLSVDEARKWGREALAAYVVAAKTHPKERADREAGTVILALSALLDALDREEEERKVDERVGVVLEVCQWDAVSGFRRIKRYADGTIVEDVGTFELPYDYTSSLGKDGQPERLAAGFDETAEGTEEGP